MGDGFWSPTAGEGEYYGIPDEGCWYRQPGAEPFWVTGGVHELYSRLGYEGGPLGMPTSNFDPDAGIQRFIGGVIFWDGNKFSSAGSAQEFRAEPFDMPAPPAQPA